MELNIDHCSIFRAFFAEFTQTQRISLLGDRKFICAPIRFSYSAPHRSKRKYRNTLTFFRRTNLYQKKKKKKETGTKKKKEKDSLNPLLFFLLQTNGQVSDSEISLILRPLPIPYTPSDPDHQNTIQSTVNDVKEVIQNNPSLFSKSKEKDAAEKVTNERKKRKKGFHFLFLKLFFFL